MILTIRAAALQLLVVDRGVAPYRGEPALPGGFLQRPDEDVVIAARRELREEAGLDAARLHLEQLGAYGSPNRDPRGRVVSVAYLAIAPGLPEPRAGTDAAGARWQPVEEVLSGRTALAFDHAEIVADGVERARTKLERTALATAFCAETFTLSELRLVYQAVWGVELDPRNFYRKVQGVPGFVVPVGSDRRTTKGRPARLFRGGSNAVLRPPLARPDPTYSSEENPVTPDLVVVLTALNIEYQAVRDRMADVRTDHERGTRFEVGRLSDGRCRVALGLTGKGNHAAGILAERAIRRYSPVAVLFVGVAGALRDSTELGDVVVATQVYAYHGGTSEDDGFKTRPRVWEIDHRISQTAAHVARRASWADSTVPGRPVPTVHFGPIAAGEVVHNSRASGEARLLRDSYNDALAVEMEGAGVAQAGHLGGVPSAVIRGISDRADGTKSSNADRTWQPMAAANAAAFAVRLAQQLITEQEHNMSNERSSGSAGTTVHNHAAGPVGIQAAYVDRSTVWVGTPPPSATTADVLAELAALREELTRARSEGGLDDPTYHAAQTELDLADKAMASGTEEGTGRFVLAMKRLRGLIADVADIASKVAGLITMADGWR